MVPLGSHLRHRQRLSQQHPRAWPGETPEDAAVFDDSVLSVLPPDIAGQVCVVREALQDATESRGEEALRRISVISRGSPLSEWRLFLRGLVDWLADDATAASEAWKRLDPERRPGRLATAMLLALRPDLEQFSRVRRDSDPDETAAASPEGKWDDALLYHAKLLRRVRFERASLRVAEAGLKLPEESRKLLLGPRKLQWLREFVKEYGETEPDLAAALARAALARAFVQNYADLFDEAVKSFPGPRHDRQSRLLTFFYYSRFENDQAAEKKAERALDDYLNKDLPQNEALPASLRGAIASQIHLNEAMAFLQPDRGGGMLDLIPREDAQAIRKHLLAAVKAAPGNHAAHKAYADWLQGKLSDERLTQARRRPLEEELASVMRSWSQALPEDVEPRLWLVDHLLENELLDEARPHVDFLAASRQDDPRVRATPWKWQLLEAMRLCRRKAWLAGVPSRLDEAEKLWPAWLSQQWLPYLRAAWTLRSGRAEAFEAERRRICDASGLVRDSLADACMMLGAAQRMRAPADDLKRLRAPVDQALKDLDRLPLEQLIDAVSFFWDLHRVQLLYPAYRNHGGKFGRTLAARWQATPGVVPDGIQEERVQKAVLWCSENRVWSDGYELTLPPFFSDPAVERHPLFVAARVNAFLKLRFHWKSEPYRKLGPLLREAAQTERDVYNRHWYLTLANELDDVLETSPKSFGFPFGKFFESDDDEDEEDLDLDFNPDCDCAACRAARRAAESQSSGSARQS